MGLKGWGPMRLLDGRIYALTVCLFSARVLGELGVDMTAGGGFAGHGFWGRGDGNEYIDRTVS